MFVCMCRQPSLVYASLLPQVLDYLPVPLHSFSKLPCQTLSVSSSYSFLFLFLFCLFLSLSVLLFLFSLSISLSAHRRFGSRAPQPARGLRSGSISLHFAL